MPLNVMDAHFRSFEHQVLPVLVREGMGVLDEIDQRTTGTYSRAAW